MEARCFWKSSPKNWNNLCTVLQTNRCTHFYVQNVSGNIPFKCFPQTVYKPGWCQPGAHRPEPASVQTQLLGRDSLSSHCGAGTHSLVCSPPSLHTALSSGTGQSQQNIGLPVNYITTITLIFILSYIILVTRKEKYWNMDNTTIAKESGNSCRNN